MYIMANDIKKNSHNIEKKFKLNIFPQHVILSWCAMKKIQSVIPKSKNKNKNKTEKII